MGNQIPNSDPCLNIDQLNLNDEETRNLHIYVWRSSSETNQYIPRTSLNFTQLTNNKTQLFSCASGSKSPSPNISFEKYVCDFRQLVAFLELSEALTLFTLTLKGYQTIYSKFNSTIIHEKCCFITHNGQVRIWINPNYYINEFWTVQQKEFRLRTSSALEVNYQTPRFMNKKEFQFQTIAVLTSQGAIIRKIIEWMQMFSKKSKESTQFWIHLQKFVQANILKNCSFQRVERFINTWAYQKKIHIKANIQDTVKSLANEGKILKNSEPIMPEKQKTKLSASFADSSRKLLQKSSIKIDEGFDSISVFDIKNVESQNFYAGSRNCNQISSRTLNRSSDYFLDTSQDYRLKAGESHGKQKISINNAVNCHQRKISKTFMHPKPEPNQQLASKIQKIPSSARPIAHQNIDNWSVKSKNQSLQLQKSVKNQLNLSYQFSIALITNQTSQIPSKQSGMTASKQFGINKENLQASTDVSDRNNVYAFDKAINPRTGSILKKNNAKSFETCKQKNPYQNDKIQRSNKKQHSVIFEPFQSQEIDSKNNTKQNKESTFAGNESERFKLRKQGLFKKFQSEHVQNQPTINLENYQTKRKTVKNRQNFCYDIKNTQKHQQDRFEEIINVSRVQKRTQNKRQLNNSDTSIGPTKKVAFQGQNSLLINIKYQDDGIQEQIIKSKRRISVGAESQFQRLSKKQNKDECEKISVINHPAFKGPNTIKGLFDSENKVQTSFGHISSTSNEFSSEENVAQKYSGVLSKMGRSVQFRKVSDNEIEKNQQLEMTLLKKASEFMPNFTRKKTICEHGSKRSMKV